MASTAIPPQGPMGTRRGGLFLDTGAGDGNEVASLARGTARSAGFSASDNGGATGWRSGLPGRALGFLERPAQVGPSTSSAVLVLPLPRASAKNTTAASCNPPRPTHGCLAVQFTLASAAAAG